MGWGEAACLGGPTWSEETAESVAAIVERYVAPWLRGSEATGIEAVSREMARRVQVNPSGEVSNVPLGGKLSPTTTKRPFP